MEDDDYEDDDYDDCDNYSSNYNGYGNNIVEKLEYNLQLLWETFLSITINQTSVGHHINHLVRTTTSPQPFKLVDYPGGSTLHLRVG